MVTQLHKRLDNLTFCYIVKQYIQRKLSLEKVLDFLKIGRSQFFNLLKRYRKDPENFSLNYKRGSPKRLGEDKEGIILEELRREKQLIENKDIPIRNYNFSYIKDQIWKNNKIKISLPTIIKRAKEYNFYIPKRVYTKHDREVLTNYIGELIQHDSSYHLFSPLADEKWYLVTSIDDYSRFILYGAFQERETSWAHIKAIEELVLKYGIPLRYYVDSHSIFRFVQGRDSIWREHKKITDEVETQFIKVLKDLKIDYTYALSPQAKGKVERPYQWLQDRVVRTCAREGIKKIEEAKEVLNYEIERYNFYQVHSTTKQIPAILFEKSIKENRTLFRDFTIYEPYKNIKDIFCLRYERMTDAYHKIKFNNIEFKLINVPVREKVEIRISPNGNQLANMRFWYKNKFIEEKIIKINDLGLSTFEI